MQQPTSSSLFQILVSLTEVAEQLSTQLSQAAKKLRETGEMPSDQLLEDVVELRRNFLDCQVQGLAMGEAAALSSVPAAATLTSLRDLKNLVYSIAKAEGQKILRDDIYQQALAVLDRVLLLQHCDQAVFPPLLDCQEQARALREAIATGRWPNFHPATESLANGEDPFSDLLSWVERKDTLDDDEWVLLQETVEQVFSKPLAIAVSRGKLILPAASSTQPAQSLSSPSPVFVGKEAPTVQGISLVVEKKKEKAEIFPPSAEARHELDEVFIGGGLGDELPFAAFSRIARRGQTEESAVQNTPQPPDTIPLEAFYSFTLEDSAHAIATAIVRASDAAHRPTALRDLTWRLLAEDKGTLAFHIASYLDAQQPHLPYRLPSWLLRAIVLGRHVRHARGETARFLEEDFSHFSPSLYLPDQREWNQAISFLLAATALQPALLAPHTQAPVVLRALRWETPLPQFSAYCKSIADYGVRQQPLDPNLLKKGKEQVAWQAELDVIKQAVELWWARAPRLSFTFTPATKVWQKWLEPRGVITSLLSPLRYNDTSNLAAVQRTVDFFSDEAQLKREIEHTDHQTLGRQLGNEISGRPMEQLLLYTREAIGFAQRWIELQEIHLGQRRGPIHAQAERLRQTIRDLHGPAQEELSLCKRQQPSPLLMSSIACCRRAMDHLQLLFDPEAAFPTEEPLPRPLLYADLLRIPSVSLNEKWEVEGSDWEALVDGILELVANGALKKTSP